MYSERRTLLVGFASGKGGRSTHPTTTTGVLLAGTGWIGQEGDRKRKEMELQRKLEGRGPDGPPPSKTEKFVFIGIAVGLVVGAVLGLLLGLSIDLLRPVFWLFIVAVVGAIIGGLIGNYFKRRAEGGRGAV